MNSCYVSKEVDVPYVNMVNAIGVKEMDLKKKSDIINSLLYDFRAEYFVALLLSEGLSQNEMMISYDGELKRKWSTDISESEVEKFENGDEVLSIYLNRSGIYDSLPEALFHRFFNNPNTTGEDMAKESMKLKAEEKEARLFFRPFENEIFFQKVKVALQENKEFNILYSEFINGLVPGFWKMDKKIPGKYALRILKLLPFAHKIAGNYDLTAHCLESVINEKVSIELSYEEDISDEKEGNKADANNLKFNQLGNCKLGYGMLIGHSVSGFVGRLDVSIGPVENTRIRDFFPDSDADLALQCFYSYFVPAELDVKTKLCMPERQKRFVSGSSTEAEFENSCLGYNTVI